MHTNLGTMFRVAILALSVTAVARAGVLTTDAAAISGWQGSIIMSGINGANVLEAQVDYAVYTKAAFDSSAALTSYLGVAPTDPGNPGDYVYAYQIFNNPPGGLSGNVGVKELSIGLDWTHGAVPTSGTSITNLLGAPPVGTAPAFQQFVPSGTPKKNGKWTYTGTGLAVGGNSDILLFTSPFGPQMMQATMTGDQTTNDGSLTPRLPSPTPEPATLVLAFFGACAAAVAWRCRRRRNRL